MFACKVLLNLFPGQESFLTGNYVQYLAAIPDGNGKQDGIALGGEIAARFLALRAGDGREAAVSFSP